MERTLKLKMPISRRCSRVCKAKLRRDCKLRIRSCRTAGNRSDRCSCHSKTSRQCKWSSNVSKETLEVDDGHKAMEIESLKNAIFDLKKRAEIGSVKPMVDFLGLDRLKEMQTKADQSTQYARECEKSMEASQKALEIAKRELDEKDRELEEVKSSLMTSKHQINLEQNQSKVLIRENEDLKGMITSLQRAVSESSSLEAVPLEEHIQILEDRDRLFREMEAKLSLLTLQKIDLEKAVEELQRQKGDADVGCQHDKSFKEDGPSQQEPIGNRGGLQETVKQVRPFSKASYVPTTAAKPQGRTTMEANQTLAMALESKTKDAQLHALKHEAENLHKDLLEYRKLAIDSRDKVKTLEDEVIMLRKENEDLRRRISGATGSEKGASGSDLIENSNNDQSGAASKPRKNADEDFVRELHDHIRSLEDQNNLLNREILGLRMRLEQAETAADSLATRLSKSLELNEKFNDQVKALNAELTKARSPGPLEHQSKKTPSIASHTRSKKDEAGSHRKSTDGKKKEAQRPKDTLIGAEIDKADIQSRVISLQSEVEDLKSQNQVLKAELLNRQHLELRIEYLQRELDLVRVGLFDQTSLQNEEDEAEADGESDN